MESPRRTVRRDTGEPSERLARARRCFPEGEGEGGQLTWQGGGFYRSELLCLHGKEKKADEEAFPNSWTDPRPKAGNPEGSLDSGRQDSGRRVCGDATRVPPENCTLLRMEGKCSLCPASPEPGQQGPDACFAERPRAALWSRHLKRSVNAWERQEGPSPGASGGSGALGHLDGRLLAPELGEDEFW